MKISSLLAAMLMILGLFIAAKAQAALPVNIEDMVKASEKIVVGEVVKVKQGHHPQYTNVSVTYITVKVAKALKGKPNQEFTFMQYGGKEEVIADMPQYKEKEEVLLFLYPESRVGFTSPVGLEQGKFHIENDAKTGERQFINGAGNYLLFDGVKSRPSMHSSIRKLLTSRKGTVSYHDFLLLIQEFAK